jgi:Fe2+ transport system protein FeoA
VNEPRWRIVLCWGLVATYLTAPLVFFIVHLNASDALDQRLMHSGFLRDFYISITGMLVSLAGLNTLHAVKTDDKSGEPSKSK